MNALDPDFPHEEYAMIVGAAAPGTARQFHNCQSMTFLDNGNSNASSKKYVDIIMADIMHDARPSGVVLPKILRRKFSSKYRSNEGLGKEDNQDQFQQQSSLAHASYQSIQTPNNTDNLTLLERVARYDDAHRLRNDKKGEIADDDEEQIDSFLPDKYAPPPSYEKESLNPSIIYSTSEIEQKLSMANATLIEIHKQLHKGEELYFQDTDNHGNLYKGWDAFVDSKADHLGIGFTNLDGDGNSGNGGGILDRIVTDNSRSAGNGTGALNGNVNKSSLNQSHNSSPPTRRMPADYRWFSGSAYSTMRDRSSNTGKTISERKRSGARRGNNSSSNPSGTSSTSLVSAIPNTSSGRISANPCAVAGSSNDADIGGGSVASDADAVKKDSTFKRAEKKNTNSAMLMPPPMSCPTVKKVNDPELTAASPLKSTEVALHKSIEMKNVVEGNSNTVKMKDSLSKSSRSKEASSDVLLDKVVDNNEDKSCNFEHYTEENITIIPKKTSRNTKVPAADGGERDTNHASLRMNEKHKRSRKEKRDVGKLGNDITLEKKRETPKKNDDHKDSKSSDEVKKKHNTSTTSLDDQNNTTKDVSDTKKVSNDLPSILSQDIPRKKRRVDLNDNNTNFNSSSGGRMPNTEMLTSVQGSGGFKKSSVVDYSDRGIVKEPGNEPDRKRKKDSKKKDAFGNDSNKRRYDSDQLRNMDSFKTSSGSSGNSSKKGHKGSDSDTNKRSHKGSDRKHKRESISPDDSKQSRKMDGSKFQGSGSSSSNKSTGTKVKSRKHRSNDG